MRASDFVEDSLRSVVTAVAYRLAATDCPSLVCAKPADCYCNVNCGAHAAPRESDFAQDLVDEGKFYLVAIFGAGLLVGLILGRCVCNGRSREGGLLCVRPLRGVRGAMA